MHDFERLAGAMMDFAAIKRLAKTVGCKVTDLIALAPQNDPFYIGTKGDWAKARWFEGIWQRGNFRDGADLRRIHYWCVSTAGLLLPEGEPYENTEKCWGYLNVASKYARYLGLIDLGAIVDRKSPETHIFTGIVESPRAWISVPDLDDPYVLVRGFEAAAIRPYHLEVWIEKSTMDDVLTPVCQRYHANLQTGVGEMTLTRVNDLGRRIREADRPVRVLYISDFDPAGHSISTPRATARKLEWVIQRFAPEAGVKLRQLALTADQVATYRLPRTPIKETEKRAARFEDAYGTGAVELDALEALYPGVLGQMVEGALSPYHDPAAARAARVAEMNLQQAISNRIQAITSRYTAEIAALKGMLDELNDAQPSHAEIASYLPPVSGHRVDDAETEWLYDSGRDYLEQMEAYRRYSVGEGEAA